MKAFLLAAGKGTRLKPLTDTIPKCLIPINGRPLLGIWLDLLQKHGISEVLINTHHLADAVVEFLRHAEARKNIRIHRIHEETLLGSGGTVMANRDFVEGETDFLILYADNLTNIDLRKLTAYHRVCRNQGGLLTMGLIHAPDPTQCGIASLEPSGRIIRFQEKPSRPESDLANAGIYVAGFEIYDYFSDIDDVATGEVLDFGFHLLPRLVGRMYGYEISAYLRDIGNLDAYAAAQAEWRKLGET